MSITVDEAIEKLFELYLTDNWSRTLDRQAVRAERFESFSTWAWAWIDGHSEEWFADPARFEGYNGRRVRHYAGGSFNSWYVTTDSYYGIYLPQILPNREVTGTPLKEALASLHASLPKQVTTRVVKGGLYIVSDSPIYAEVVGKMRKIRVEGHGKDRYIGTRTLERAIADASDMRNERLSRLRLSMKQRLNTPATPKKPVRSGMGNIDIFLSKIAQAKGTKELVIGNFSVPPRGVASSRPFGMEIEVAGALGVKRQPGWGSKSDGSLHSAYDDHREEHFNNLDMDRYGGYKDTGAYFVTGCPVCDVMKQHAGDHETREFVSPILNSFHSEGLRKMIDQIVTQPQNDSAGVHVHVAVDDLNVKQIGSLVYGYSVIEPIIEASYQRTKREYCQRRDTEELSEIGRSIKRLLALGDSDARQAIYAGDRYVTLNLCAINDHSTVEFRAMGPVYDYEYLIKWAYFCREMVNVAKAGVTPSEWNRVKDFGGLLALFIRKGKETVDTQLSQLTAESIKKLMDRNVDMIDWSQDGAGLAAVGGEI